MADCPACRRNIQDGSPECPFCGIIVAKYKGDKTHSSPVAPQEQPHPPSSGQDTRTDPGTVIARLIPLFVVAIILYVSAHKMGWLGAPRTEPAPVSSQPAQAPAPLPPAQASTPLKEEQPTVVPSQPEPTPLPGGGEELVIALTQRTLLSSRDEILKRLDSRDVDFRESDVDYDASRESFDLFVPATYRSDAPHGLLVWVSPANTGAVPALYKGVLAQHQVLWAAARNSGNERSALERLILALDVADETSRRYSIDSRRVWVGGFSGGGRTASRAAFMYPEVFAGGLFVCGVNYMRTTWSDKRNRFFFLTGDGDFNLDDTKNVYRAYVKEGYANIQLTVVPNMGHELPPAPVFSQALGWLDSK